MMSEWHRVQIEELKTVSEWLEFYLPESWKVFGTVRETLAGRWQGQSIYTLGWPDIRGVVEGQVETDHPCRNFVENENSVSLFAPDDRDIDTILRSVFVDWTKTLILMGVTDRTCMLAETLAGEQGLNLRVDNHKLHFLMASPGDVPLIPVPAGFKIRKLSKDTDVDHCVSVWQRSRAYMDQYVGALMGRVPNVCVANSDDLCVSFEMGTEYSCMAMLHTREQYRGQGLAKVTVSHLAHEYFRDNLLAVTCVEHDNTISLALHLALGFRKTDARLSVLVSRPQYKI